MREYSDILQNKDLLLLYQQKRQQYAALIQQWGWK